MQKKNCRKNQNGITLIALVITIIILLILAGVSINLVVGNNGILDRATDAIEHNEKAAVVEQVSMAWSACQTDYMAEGRKKPQASYFTEEKLNSSLSKGEIIKSSLGIDASGNSELAYKVNNLYYKVQITSEGDVNVIGDATTAVPIISDSIEEPYNPPFEITKFYDKAEVGDYVNYSKSLDLTLNLEGESIKPKADWRVFHKDNGRVYLIASDYVPNKSSLLKTLDTGMTTNRTYELYWSTAPNALSNVNRKDSIFGITSSSYILNESNINSKCVSTLLDTANWNNFVDIKYADYAIGGPSIELFASSWNSNSGYITLIPTSDNSWFGYKINDSDFVDLVEEGLSNNLYCSHKNGVDGCFGYWLASPAVNSSNDIMYCSSIECLENYSFCDNQIGVRPVVALKLGVEAEKDVSTGVWILK